MLQIDQRVRRSHEKVRAAAIAELAAVGWGGFTVDGVATRAGVARSTVYRHWPDKHALVVDALEHHSTQPPPAGETGRARVITLLRHLAEVMGDPERSALIPALAHAADQDAELRRLSQAFADRRRQALVDALTDLGIADPELTAIALAGAVLYCRLLGAEPLDPARAEDLAEAILGPEATSS